MTSVVHSFISFIRERVGLISSQLAQRPRILDSIILVGLLLISSGVIFYQLGAGSLHPYDEAWYAAISRELTQDQTLLEMDYNEEPYWDHPPLGFYLMNLSFRVVGESTLTARLPQALLGLASIVLIYWTGRNLKNRPVGIMAALMLISSRWFLLRARTGNLDVGLVFFQLLTFFWVVQLPKHRKLWLVTLALGLALSMKTTISITLFPMVGLAVVIFLWQLWRESGSIAVIRELIISSSTLALPLLPWYGHNLIEYRYKFFERNVLHIGLRDGARSQLGWANIQKLRLYFQASVHHWFKPMVGGSILMAGVTLFQTLKRIWDRKLWLLLVYLTGVTLPYIVSDRFEIWHLLPMIPPAALLSSYAIDWVGTKVTEIIANKMWSKSHIDNLLGLTRALSISAVLLICCYSLWQFRSDVWAVSEQDMSIPEYFGSFITDKSIPVYITSLELKPAVVYYFDTEVTIETLYASHFIQRCETPFQLPFYVMTNRGYLEKTTGYDLLAERGELVLLEYRANECQVIAPNL